MIEKEKIGSNLFRGRDAFNREYFIPLTFRRELTNEMERKARSRKTESKRLKERDRRRLNIQKHLVNPRGTIQMGLRSFFHVLYVTNI